MTAYRPIRFAVRVVAVGSWCLLGGLALVVAVDRLRAALESDADGRAVSATGVDVGALVTDALTGAAELGALSVGLGVCLVFVGGRMFFGRRRL